ncbi:ABC transporter substrate-binding protein [Azospirillum thiophilum]|uniref:ABC transporter substrate-binding protein n=1 Tax=Azospirillum thiophilum TaxID=528244 RepID=A0AAC9EWX9_9PROT|nr:ABC transporter substrate-binding protein [Azospirillum thiophilum]ALG69834.1 ABC transporter substrate-binding protein [Azospirillum thiophilum]KJR66482.1 ABC transporter substrate-binding protein [Azospirillum thiophilum]
MKHRRPTAAPLAKSLLSAALFAVSAAVAAAAGPAAAQTAQFSGAPVRVGEINSYTGLPAFTIPYRQGWQLALEEINAQGGVIGCCELQVVSRDDAGKPDDAVRVAQELVTNEAVDVLAGTYFSHIGLAVADFAARNKMPFVAAEPLTDAITWSKGNRYTFRLRPSTYMQAAMLVEEAAKLPAKRWATVAPNYEYGQSAVAWFKQLLKEKRPDVEFVAEQWPAQGKLEAGPTVQALAAARPDAIFNVTFGADLAKFVREGEGRGLFRNRKVVSLLTGEPEYLEPMKDEAPEGWIVTGYPWEQIDTPAHKAFVAAYTARFKDTPKQGSLVGYITMKAVAAAVTKAKSANAEPIVDALAGLTIDTPVGPVTFRASDHQATMGAYVGTTTVKDGRGTMKDWRYADGANYLPSDEAVRKLRPAE